MKWQPLHISFHIISELAVLIYSDLTDKRQIEANKLRGNIIKIICNLFYFDFIFIGILILLGNNKYFLNIRKLNFRKSIETVNYATSI